MKPASRRTIIAAAAIVAAAVVVGVIYAAYDPALAVFFPKCLFKAATGYDCPGCGTQRAIHSLLHGDIAAAWRYNAALFVAVPIIIAVVAGRLFPRRLGAMARVTGSRPFILAIFFAAIAWWVGRNL